MAMDDIYYELTVEPSSHLEQFSDFLCDVLPVGFEERDGKLIIHSEDSLESISWGVEKFCEALCEATGLQISVQMHSCTKETKEWVEIYESSIEPIKIDPFYIYPTWCKPDNNSLNIKIDPALAFGTGHHATTASCLKALATHVKSGDRVLDVGCGSGILSIASTLLGADVDACDTDPISVEATRENYNINSVALNKIWEGSASMSLDRYDVIVANIVADVLVMIEKDLKKLLKKGGILILSGILDKYEDKIITSFSSMQIIQTIKQDEWITVVATTKDK